MAPGQYRLWFHGGSTWVTEWWNDKRNDWDADIVAVNADDHVLCNATLDQAGSISGHVTVDEATPRPSRASQVSV